MEERILETKNNQANNAPSSQEKRIVKVGGADLDLVTRRRNEFVLANHRLSYQAYRFFMFVLSQVKMGHDENTEYEFSVFELANTFGIDRKHLYTAMVSILDELASKIVQVPVFDKDGKLVPHIYDRVGLIKNKQRIKTVAEGTERVAGSITVSLHKELLPYVLDIRSRYTEIELKYVFELRSSYSQRLYDLLKYHAWKGRPWRVGRSELRESLGVEEGQFKNWGDFRRFVLERAQKEIEATDVPFDIEYVVNGREVIEIIFRFRKCKPQTASLPGTPRHAAYKGMLDLGMSATDAEQMLDIWWEKDPNRVTWHLSEAQRRKTIGKVGNAVGWFKAGMKKNYGPKSLKERQVELQQSAMAKREDYAREKYAGREEDLKQALETIKKQFDVNS